MQIRFLGTGTSSGVPVPGCSCEVCKSTSKKDKRTRTSGLFTLDGYNLLIDTSPDFYHQVLRENIQHIDAVLFTHDHADHLHGIDDLRPFSWKHEIPLFCNELTASAIQSRFPYLFIPKNTGGGKPNLVLHSQKNNTFKVGPFSVDPIEVFHGEELIWGYRINNSAWITDCKTLPSQSIQKVQNLDVLVLNALKEDYHDTHLTLAEAGKLTAEIAPKETYFIHFSHNHSHQELITKCMLIAETMGIKKIEPAYDGLLLDTTEL
jgi:phosphoribosyl 1,2-cyclic phosphate phosphodiesterase